ncbi:pseudaminic acid synthase [Sinorhizobium sp. RAC02]|uniref:pseudaminic acid synthase n=1 Tax=Sinorhizobium sp. RAC02 TaxID=1842534 RepID=UPI00083E45A7|nr:pseudaminic acid synthase [Sinorhizobium sp. RAC02]
MSGNHNASLERALRMVDIAAEAGADAVKLQTFKPETMTLNVKKEGFTVTAEKSLWKGRELFSLFKEAQTAWEWHKPIFERAKERGILCFSSAFDESSVDFLEEMGAPAYKIASFECTDVPLIRYVAQTGKPMIISTGMASLGEIEDAVGAARDGGCTNLTLLKCTSTYPATPETSNLLTIPHMKSLFGCDIGLSDHTLGIGAAIAAVAFGATVIEKHYTIARADGGVDSAFSLEPDEFKSLVTETKVAHAALGRISYGASAEEQHARSKRRSLYIAADMAKGDILTKDNLKRIRPGLGLAPKYYESMLGRRVNRDLEIGTPFTLELIG